MRQERLEDAPTHLNPIRRVGLRVSATASHGLVVGVRCLAVTVLAVSGSTGVSSGMLSVATVSVSVSSNASRLLLLPVGGVGLTSGVDQRGSGIVLLRCHAQRLTSSVASWRAAKNLERAW